MVALDQGGRAAPLALLTTLSEARATYGLRHDDHTRYRHFCTRRIQRLRSGAGIAQRQTCSKRYAAMDLALAALDEEAAAATEHDGEGGSGDENEGETTPARVDKAANAEKAKVAKVPLRTRILLMAFTCERYWAYAMDLREQAKAGDAVTSNQKRRHMLKKLKRGAAEGILLEKAVAQALKAGKTSGPADSSAPTAEDEAPGPQDVQITAADMLEVRAYVKVLEGYLQFEQHDWARALEAFAQAKAVYEDRRRVAETTDNDHAQAARCQAAMDGIEPQIRYCRYALAKRGAEDPDALVKLIHASRSTGDGGSAEGAGEVDLVQRELDALLDHVESGERAAAQSATIEFLGEPLEVRNGAVAQLLAQASELASSIPRVGDSKGSDETATRRAQLAAYQTLISALQRAEKRAQADMAAHDAASRAVATSTGTHVATRLHRVAGFAAHARRVVTARRNLLMISFAAAEARARAVAGHGQSAAHTGGERHKDQRAGGAGAGVSKPMASRALDQLRRKHVAERARLLENVVQNLAEMRATPLVSAHPPTARLLDAALAQYRSSRARDLGLALALQRQWRAAMGEFNRARTLLGEADAYYSEKGAEEAWPPTVPLLTKKEFETLQADLAGRDVWVRAQHALTTTAASHDVGSRAPQGSCGGTVLLPPPLTHAPYATGAAVPTVSLSTPAAAVAPLPVPSKPIFFDLAFNEIDFPNLDEETSPRQEPQPPLQKLQQRKDKPAKKEAPKNEDAPQAQEDQPQGSGLGRLFGGLWGSR